MQAENLNRKCETLRAEKCYIERKGDPHRSKVLGLFAECVQLYFAKRSTTQTPVSKLLYTL